MLERVCSLQNGYVRFDVTRKRLIIHLVGTSNTSTLRMLLSLPLFFFFFFFGTSDRLEHDSFHRSKRRSLVASTSYCGYFVVELSEIPVRIVESGLVQTNLRIDTWTTNLLLYFNTVWYLSRLRERVLLGNRDNSKVMNHSHRSFQDQILTLPIDNRNIQNVNNAFIVRNNASIGY